MMMGNGQVMILPPGVKFSPSDEEALVHYLKPKIYGFKLPCNAVQEREIYGPNANPWHLFDASSTLWTEIGSEKSVYVFTRLTKMSTAATASSRDKKTEHYVRKAGCGTWHGETGRAQKPIMEGGNVVGNKRLLVYQINDIGGLGDGVNLDHVGYWKMHEYSLNGFEDYVLCQITWDTSKEAKVVASNKSKESCSSTKPKAKRDTCVITPTDDAQVVGVNDPRLSSEKDITAVQDLGLVQDNYLVPQGSGNWMNTDSSLQQTSTSCANNVPGDSVLQAMEYLFEDLSEEEVACYKNLSFQDIDEMLNDTLEEFDEEPAMQDYSSSQVLGKRKAIQVEQSAGKRICI